MGRTHRGRGMQSLGGYSFPSALPLHASFREIGIGGVKSL